MKGAVVVEGMKVEKRPSKKAGGQVLTATGKAA